MAPLVHALAQDEAFESRICVTAQHREMLDQVLRLFSITPDYDLDIMRPGQSLSEISCRILAGLEPVMAGFKPDLVLVHGDTTTTLTTSLAAFINVFRSDMWKPGCAPAISIRPGRKRPTVG